MNGAFALDDGALGVLLRFLQVALDHGDAFDARPLFFSEDLKNLALLALMGARDDDDDVAAF